MDKAQAIIDYIQAVVNHAIAKTEVGPDGYYTSHPDERRSEEQAESVLRKAFREGVGDE